MAPIFLGLTIGMATINAPRPSIIPEPVSLVQTPDSFELSQKTGIAAAPDLHQLGIALQDSLRPATGFLLPIHPKNTANSIHLSLQPTLERLGPEGYRLNVTPGGIDIQAYKPAGLFYGIQTLRQLLPVEIFRKAPVAGQHWTVPGVQIEDQPRFGWRGLLVDTGRHFMPKEFLLKFIDVMALQKLNTLHLHLTEDQGWRIQIKKYPKLTEIGSMRNESMAGHYSENRYDGTPHGGFYTQDDLKEIVRYAQDRFVTVMPEIEMPGHSQAAIAAYPELGNTGKQLEVGTHWGVFENVYNANDHTIHFLQDVLSEVLDIFPSKFIHVGGDEVPKTQWKASPEAQARIKELGLKDEHELQSWFIQQMDKFLAAKGRRLVGWDEILEGGLAPGATVMSWRGEEGGIAAARAGHDVIMTPGDSTYLDHYQTKDRKAEGVAIGGFLPIEKVYAYEPIPKELSEQEAKHVLGAQGQLWSEYIPDPKRMEFMAYPRACALAEVLWTPKAERSYEGFASRLETHKQRLTILDVNFYKAPKH